MGQSATPLLYLKAQMFLSHEQIVFSYVGGVSVTQCPVSSTKAHFLISWVKLVKSFKQIQYGYVDSFIWN